MPTSDDYTGGGRLPPAFKGKILEQTKLGSLLEACINTLIGFVGSIVLSLVVYPAFGHSFPLAQTAGITLIFTIWSILRGYAVRRWFEGRIRAAARRMATMAQ